MAKGFGTEIESQVQSIRARMHFGRIDGVELFETTARLNQLDRSLQSVGSTGDAELFRHFPVAAVAVLESHFKAAVASIVNAGSPYLERGLALSKDRLKSAVDVVPLLHRKAVTIGEVVAHVIPFNSVSSLEVAFSMLLGADIKNLVAEARDPYRLRSTGVGAAELLVVSVDDLWRGLALAFERRHILAHEAATKFDLSFDEARDAVNSCAAFVSALDAVMWTTIWKDLPLTQYEMNVDAWSSCRAERKALAAEIRIALTAATEMGERARFRELHRAWKEFNKRWLAWEDEAFAMGSIRPMIAANSRERALHARREAVRGWLSLMRPTDG
ncbi:hypothetical protein [Roseateles amylovorans]|uniref:DUF1311 domain-containing protein n=1 Tax=Roseateles amylovorans TaxID=2978473 RepID=A0ABY6B030_9BURK|nr:hypothetical protein [Roseateles amylovorans]UXH77908.1 hypothetical protein N4261_23550 [Roseateles amylovorans]